MRAALTQTEWDAVYDVSGFVMAAGGSSFADLLDLLDGSVGAYVFVSSIMAYEPQPVQPWTEDLPTTSAATSTYGGFKAYAEAEIRDRHRRTGFPGSIVRPAAIYGPENNILDMEAAMFLRLGRRLPILLPHGGLVLGNYGHVDDLCALLAAAARSSQARGEVINATGDGVTSGNYVRLLADIVGVEPDIRMVPDHLLDRPGGQLFCHLFNARHHAMLSTEKARRDLGLPVERGFVRGHEQTYEWFRSSSLVDAPDVLSDPVWGAGYDFVAEAAVAAAL